MLNKFGFDTADLARLHGCVVHEIEGITAEEWETAIHLGNQKEILADMLKDDNENQDYLLLSLVHACICGEIIREQESLVDEVDANKRAFHHDYLSNLEKLRARIKAMIKAGL